VEHTIPDLGKFVFFKSLFGFMFLLINKRVYHTLKWLPTDPWCCVGFLWMLLHVVILLLLNSMGVSHHIWNLAKYVGSQTVQDHFKKNNPAIIINLL